MEFYDQKIKDEIKAEQAKKSIKAQKAANTREINILTEEITDLNKSIEQGSKYRLGEPIHLVRMSYKMDLNCALKLRKELNQND